MFRSICSRLSKWKAHCGLMSYSMPTELTSQRSPFGVAVPRAGDDEGDDEWFCAAAGIAPNAIDSRQATSAPARWKGHPSGMRRRPIMHHQRKMLPVSPEREREASTRFDEGVAMALDISRRHLGREGVS